MVDSASTTTPGTRTSRTSRVEARSIDYVPASERHGKTWRQGPFWFLGNFQPFTLSLGLIGPSLGLSLGWTVVASVLGIAFGTLFMAFHATQGPVLGLPQMVQSRAQFGYRGVMVPLFATLFTFVAFNVVDVVIIKEGLAGIFGWNATVVAIVITLAGALLAVYGHDWLHQAFIVLFCLSVPLFVVLTVALVLGGIEATAPLPDSAFSFTWVAFLVQFTIVAAYNVTYAPYVSDYSRYLPRDTRPVAIIASVFFGAIGSPIWLIPLGAWFAINLGSVDPIAGLYDAGQSVVGGLGAALVIVSVGALVATMGLNAYSAMLTVVTAMDSVRPTPLSARLRVLVIAVITVVWLVLSLSLEDSVGALLTSLTLMLYLLAPWTAVNLTDFFFVRRGHYAITHLFRLDGVYHQWSRNGLVAYALGLVAMLPFMVLNFGESVSYTGFAASAMDGVDLAFVVGLAVSAVAYVVMMRGVDLAAEEPAVRESEQLLADLDAQQGADTAGASRA